MALLKLEGFDDGLAATRGWGITTITSAAVRTGTNGVQVGDSGNKQATWVSDEQVTSGVIGFAYNVKNDASRATMNTFRIRDGGSNHLTMFRKLDGSVYMVGPFGTSADSATDVLPEDSWRYVQIKFTIDNSAGSFEIVIDGVSVLSDSSIDTQVGSNAYADQYYWAGTQSSDTWISYFDDVYLIDDTTTVSNDFLGDTRVYPQYPIGDGNQSDMTGSDADQIDNWALVDNSPNPSSTDYVGSVTEGHIDTYAMTALPSTNLIIHGVVTSVYGAKSDAGDKFMRHVLRTGSTGGAQSDNVGTTYPLGVSYLAVDETWSVNPVTSTQWTPGEINAMEVGQEGRDTA